MNKAALSDILSQVTRSGIKRVEIPGGSQHAVIEGEGEEKLLSVLKADPELGPFGGKIMNDGDGGGKTSFASLAQWLLIGVADQGIENTVDRLETYLNLPGSPAYEILAISGIATLAPITLSDRLALIPASRIPSGRLKDEFTKFEKLLKESPLCSNLAGVPLMHSALIRRIEIRPKFFSDGETEKKGGTDGSELREACLFFTLIQGSAPIAVSHWIQFEEWIPCAHLSPGRPIPLDRAPHLLDTPVYIESNKAVEIYHGLARLDQKTKQGLKVSLERLNQSRRRRNSVDKAIDLGIALEALLLKERKHDDPLALPFRLHGAWLLGQHAGWDERRKLLNLFYDLYECRSKAVHQGRLEPQPEKYKSKRGPDDILALGDELCVKIIQEVIKGRRFPTSHEWNDLLIGSSL